MPLRYYFSNYEDHAETASSKLVDFRKTRAKQILSTPSLHLGRHIFFLYLLTRLREVNKFTGNCFGPHSSIINFLYN